MGNGIYFGNYLFNPEGIDRSFLIVSGFTTFLGILGIGMILRANWVRYPAIAMCGLHLIGYPLGTAVGIRGLAVLLDGWRMFGRSQYTTEGLKAELQRRASLHNERADKLIHEGEHVRACDELTSVIECDPNYPSAYCNRSRVRQWLGEFRLATEDGNEAVWREPQNPLALLVRGNAWHAQAELKRAIKDYTAALQLAPDYSDAYYNRGLVWARQGNWSKAIEQFTEAIRLAPDLIDAYAQRAAAWEATGELSMANADRERVSRLSETKD
jgi:tetratricopeptide (TPR) repeat protein